MALSETDFQCDRTALSEMLPGMSGNDSVRVKPILPAIQSPDRIVQHYFALQSVFSDGI